MYKCSKCNLSVVVLPEQIIRPCDCNATIIMDLCVTLEGTAKTSL